MVLNSTVKYRYTTLQRLNEKNVNLLLGLAEWVVDHGPDLTTESLMAFFQTDDLVGVDKRMENLLNQTFLLRHDWQTGTYELFPLLWRFVQYKHQREELE